MVWLVELAHKMDRLLILSFVLLSISMQAKLADVPQLLLDALSVIFFQLGARRIVQSIHAFKVVINLIELAFLLIEAVPNAKKVSQSLVLLCCIPLIVLLLSVLFHLSGDPSRPVAVK